MDSENAAGTAFSIINNYVRFIELQSDRRRYDCPTDKHWEQFMPGRGTQAETDDEAATVRLGAHEKPDIGESAILQHLR